MARGGGWRTNINPRARDIIDGAAARGLALAAEHVLGEANKKVPIEEGTLERSGTTSVDEANLQAAISYDTPYAVKQHEVPMNHDGGRTHKWLENTLNAEMGEVQEIIAKAIRREI